MTLTKFWLDNISDRIIKAKNERKLSQLDLCDDTALISCIEHHKFKKNNSTFIPDEPLGQISERLGWSIFQTIYGSKKELTNFIDNIFEKVIHNFKVKNYDGETNKEFIEIDTSLLPVTQKLIEALFSDAEFTWHWYADKDYSSSKLGTDEYNTDFFPTYISDNTSGYFDDSAQDFFERTRKTFLYSYEREFIQNEEKISLKNFDKKVTSWVIKNWPKIIKDQIKIDKNNILFLIGYDVKDILDESNLPKRLEQETIKLDSSFIKFYESTKKDKNFLDKIKTEKKDFLIASELIHKLADTYKQNAAALRDMQIELMPKFSKVYKQNAKALRDMQDTLRTKMPRTFKHYFTNHWPHFADRDTSLNDLADVDFFVD